MDALQRGHVDEPDAVAAEQQPGAWKRRGSATKPPSGIVFAPHSTRSPPSRIGRIRGWVFSSWSRSCDGELGVAVVEPDDHPDRDHVRRPSGRRTSRRTRGSAPPARSGQPIVWITRSSGRATFHTSFTPSAQTCGLVPGEPEPLERGAGEVALRPLGEDRHAGA